MLPIRLLISSLLLTCASEAQNYRLAERLPAEALAYLSVPDPQHARNALGSLGVVAMMNEPDTRRLKEGIGQLLELGMEQLPVLARSAIEQMYVVCRELRGELAFALLDIDPSSGMPHFAVALDFGTSADPLKEDLERWLGIFAEQGATLGSYELGGRSIQTLRYGPVEVHHAWVGHAWVATNAPEQVGALIAPEGVQGHSLASEESFLGGARAVLPDPGSAVLHLHVGVSSLWERYGGMIPPEVRAFVLAFGLERFHGFAYGLGVEDGAVVERLRLHAPEGMGRLADFVAGPGTQHRLLPYVPSNAFLYGSQRVSFQAWSEALLDLAEMSVPGGDEAVTNGLDDFEDQFGFRLESDFVNCLGREVAFYVALPEGGGIIPEMVVAIELRDAPSLREMLEMVMQRIAEMGSIRLEMQRHEYRGLTFYSLEAPEYRMEPRSSGWSTRSLGWSFWPRPCLFAHEDVGIMTLFPHTMKSVIDRVAEGGAQPSLAQESDFAAVFSRAPHGHGAFAFVRMKGLLSIVYNTVAPIASGMVQNFLRDQGLPIEIDLIDLPSARTFAKHLVDLAAWETSDDHGMTWTVVSPIGIAPTIALVAVPFLFLAGG